MLDKLIIIVYTIVGVESYSVLELQFAPFYSVQTDSLFVSPFFFIYIF